MGNDLEGAVERVRKWRNTIDPEFPTVTVLRSDLRLILAALSAQDGWKDIASAPKDGRRVLLASFAVAHAGKAAEWSITAGSWVAEFEYNYDADTDTDEYRGAWSDGRVASWNYQECAELAPASRSSGW